MKKVIVVLMIYALLAGNSFAGNGDFVVDGSLGVGTSTPAGKLDVRGGPVIAGYAGGQLKITGGTVDGGVWTGNDALLRLADWNTGTKGLVVNMASGNVGVGTTGPTSQLEILGNSNWAQGWRHVVKLTSNDYPTIRLHSLNSGKSSFIGNNNDGGLWFGVNGTDTISGLSAMNLDTSGNLHVSGVFYPSDAVIKEGITTIPDAIDRLKTLRAVYYKLKDEPSDRIRHIGVIAQEVEVAFPELVHQITNPKCAGQPSEECKEPKLKAVDYPSLAAVAVQGVNELSKKVEQLEKRLLMLEQAQMK